MSAWLITILRNLFRTEYRKRRREVEDADGRHVDSLKSPPEQHSRVEFEEFRVALAKLPAGQREALLPVDASASPMTSCRGESRKLFAAQKALPTKRRSNAQSPLELSVHCRSSSTSAVEALYKLSSGCSLQ
jgi:hypothetical protein